MGRRRYSFMVGIILIMLGLAFVIHASPKILSDTDHVLDPYYYVLLLLQYLFGISLVITGIYGWRKTEKIVHCVLTSGYLFLLGTIVYVMLFGGFSNLVVAILGFVLPCISIGVINIKKVQSIFSGARGLRKVNIIFLTVITIVIFAYGAFRGMVLLNLSKHVVYKDDMLLAVQAKGNEYTELEFAGINFKLPSDMELRETTLDGAVSYKHKSDNVYISFFSGDMLQPSYHLGMSLGEDDEWTYITKMMAEKISIPILHSRVINSLVPLEVPSVWGYLGGYYKPLRLSLEGKPSILVYEYGAEMWKSDGEGRVLVTVWAPERERAKSVLMQSIGDLQFPVCK